MLENRAVDDSQNIEVEHKDKGKGESMKKVFAKWMLCPTLLVSLVSVALCPSARAQSGGTQPAATQEAQVSNIQWMRPSDPDSAYASASGGLQVLTGTTVVFRAVKDDNSRAWATGQPHWGGVASGTGETTSVTFNTLSSSTSDYKTVTVTGAGTDTAKSDVTVFDLILSTSAQEQFTGRSEDNYGVGEVVNLLCVTKPSVPVPGIVWMLNGNLSRLSGTSLTMGEYPGSVTAKATITNGASRGMTRDVTRKIITPNSAYMLQKPSGNLRHTFGFCGVGFEGWIYMGPKYVSFSNLEFREYTVNAVATGIYSSQNDRPHAIGDWLPIFSGDSTTGNRVNCVDTVDTGDVSGPAPFAVGPDGLSRFDWYIPWHWRLANGNNWYNFTTGHHSQIASSDGTATISKKDAGPFPKTLNEPTSTY